MILGYDLSRWAQHVSHPCLTARTRQVLSAICMVAHDEHGEFWMRGQKFVDENLPGMTYGAYRNHLSTLVRNELLLKVEHGGGSTSGGRGTTTRYRVNSPVVMTPHPEQGVLPDIPKSSQAQPGHPEVSDEQPSVSAIEVHQRVDDLLAAGITTEQMVEILKAVSETLTGSINMSGNVTSLPNLSEKLTGLASQTGHEAKHVRPNMSGNVTGSPNLSEKLTGSDNLSGNVTGSEDQTCQETRHVSPKPVRKRDKLSIHEEKKLEEKDDAAAAANLSDSAEENLSGFFEILARALADSGYPGIRAAQFTDLTSFLQDYANLTGSPPDQRTADYIVGRVSETTGIRNVAAFVRRLAHDVLTTGEGYVAQETAQAPPSERPAGPLPPLDWSVLHLAHVEQMSSAQAIWATVLEVLRGQVSRTAFETWVAEANGVAYAEGKFVVGSANSFASEMLKNRMHPQIARAVRDATGTEVIIEYAVVAPDDRKECSLCQAGEARVEAS